MQWLWLVSVSSKISTMLKKACIWIKSHGDIVAIVAVAIIVSVTGRRINLTEIIKRKKENYQKQIDVIESSHDEEIKKREEALYRYHAVIEDIEKNHENSQKQLDANKKKMIKEIIKENADNPDEITRRIAEITGFAIYVE